MNDGSLTIVRRPEEGFQTKNLFLIVLQMMDTRRYHNRESGPWDLLLHYSWTSLLEEKYLHHQSLLGRLRKINKMASVQVDDTLPEFGITLRRVSK